MATEVAESIELARAKASAILYGNEKPPEAIRAYDSPVVAEYSIPVKEEAKSFSGYVFQEPPRPQGTAELRTYQVPDEFNSSSELKLVKPYVEAVSVPYTPPVSVKKSSSALEELDEDATYVVKFKAPTLITAAAVAVVFVLLAVLFIVNAVSIASTNARLEQLRTEQITAAKELEEATRLAGELRDNIVEEIMDDLTNNPGKYTDIPKAALPVGNAVPYVAPAAAGSTNLFDIICKFLSGLFG